MEILDGAFVKGDDPHRARGFALRRRPGGTVHPERHLGWGAPSTAAGSSSPGPGSPRSGPRISKENGSFQEGKDRGCRAATVGCASPRPVN